MIVCIAALMFDVSARGQTLDLSGAPQIPNLQDRSYLLQLREQLEREIAQRAAALRPNTPTEDLLLRASANYRSIASDLLQAAHESHPDGSVAFLYALLIADGRMDLDQSLLGMLSLEQRLSTPGAVVDEASTERYARARRMVRLFNQQAVHHAANLQTIDIDTLDTHLPIVFSPLAQAIAALEDADQPPTYWPRAHDIVVPNMPRAHRLSADRSTDSNITVASLRERLPSVPLPQETRDIVAETLDYLERGLQFADLQPIVRRYLGVLHSALDAAETFDRTRWLPNPVQQRLVDTMIAALARFSEPDMRDEASVQLRWLSGAAETLQRLQQLIDQRANRQRVTRPLIDLFLALEATVHADDDNDVPVDLNRSLQHLDSLNLFLDRMIAYRVLKEHQLRQELRAVQLRLQSAYENAEQRMIQQIDRLVLDADAMGDPAMGSHVLSQRQYLTDLRRISRIADWLKTIDVIAPEAATPFFHQSRKMAAWLLDTNRRPDAIMAMTQFEQQLALFYPMPFEDVLRSQPVLAARATGGMHEQLLREMQTTRRAWAVAWGDGNAGSRAANRMLMLYRLALGLEQSTRIEQADGDLSILNRWPGWQLNGQAMARVMSDLPSRLKLAVAAAIDGNDDELRRQLERIDRDAPLVKLTGRLLTILAEDMQARPGDPLATLGQLLHPPHDDAWLIERRMQLAAICRFALEQEHAYANEARDRYNRLHDYVAFQAGDLLQLLGERRDPLPTLIGFDGSDPNPDVPEIRR